LILGSVHQFVHKETAWSLDRPEYWHVADGAEASVSKLTKRVGRSTLPTTWTRMSPLVAFAIPDVLLTWCTEDLCVIVRSEGRRKDR